MNWNIISFSDNNGVITEYLATNKSVAYFAPEYNAKLHIGDLSKEDAFETEAELNNKIMR